MDAKYADMEWYRQKRWSKLEGEYGIYFLIFNDACTLKIGQTSGTFVKREEQIHNASRNGAAMQWAFPVPQTNEDFFRIDVSPKIKKRFNTIYLESMECILREFAYRRAMKYENLRVLYVGDRIEGSPDDVIKFAYDWKNDVNEINAYFSYAATLVNIVLENKKIVSEIKDEKIPSILVKDKILRTFYILPNKMDGETLDLDGMKEKAWLAEIRKRFAKETEKEELTQEA